MIKTVKTNSSTIKEILVDGVKIGIIENRRGQYIARSIKTGNKKFIGYTQKEAIDQLIENLGR